MIKDERAKEQVELLKGTSQNLTIGVETADQTQFLNAENCDFVQGYYYSKPLSIEEIEEYIRQSTSSKVVNL